MAFSRGDVEILLARCHRRCCICHRFCGVKIETDHIVPREQGGGDDIDNAIAVCFECHAEIHSYNDRHPRGRKFLPGELRVHRDQWLAICDRSPETFVGAGRDDDVGPLQALVDELEFNLAVAQSLGSDEQGCLFLDHQFLRAIQEGSVAMLLDELKSSVLVAYRVMRSANLVIEAAWKHARGSNAWAEASNEARRRIREAQPAIDKARADLLHFLGGDEHRSDRPSIG